MAESVVWLDPDGATLTFSKVEYSLSGRWFPTTVVDEELVPGQPGARLREVRHGPLEFAMSGWLLAATETALRTAVRSAVYLLDPTRGVGTIRATAPGGDQRDLACICVDGLPLSERLGDTATPLAQKFTLAFRAHDPYWSAVSDVTQAFTIGSTPSFFPFFPLRLTSSQIAVDTTVTNDGDVSAWPVWTITGPGSGIYLRNLTTGQVLDFSSLGGLTLGTGETAVIDTRYKTVTKNDGTNLWPYLTLESSLWSLAKGSTAVRLEMAGTSGASALQLQYRPRYLSP